MTIEITNVAQATTTRLLSLIKTLNKYSKTSLLMFLPSHTKTRRRFPVQASITNTVINVTIVALAITTNNAPNTKAPKTRMRNHDHHDSLSLLSFNNMYNEETITNKHDIVVVVVVGLVIMVYFYDDTRLKI